MKAFRITETCVLETVVLADSHPSGQVGPTYPTASKGPALGLRDTSE